MDFGSYPPSLIGSGTARTAKACQRGKNPRLGKGMIRARQSFAHEVTFDEFHSRVVVQGYSIFDRNELSR